MQINQNFSENGLRVLAFAYKELQEVRLEAEDNYTFVGLMAMIDPPREESKLVSSNRWCAFRIFVSSKLLFLANWISATSVG